jgi:2-oxoglutarate ferredoxin oxidoreductase subunit alpha
VPGTAGLEHRIGGIEKDAITGHVSYEASNHQLMTDTRAWKIKNIANDIPMLEVQGDADAEILVLGWGSTLGVVKAAARRARLEGEKVAFAHLRHLNPFPANLGDVLARYGKILIPELNSGQLRWILRAEFLVDAEGINKVAGVPFKIGEIQEKIMEMLKA